MAIAELQVYSVEEADVTGGVCVVRCVGGVARAGQVYAVGELRLSLRRIERYGRPVAFFDAGHAARVHLAGAVVALLTRGQVLTSVPPDGHALEELEAWLATGPPLLDEPLPVPLRILAVSRMRSDRLPDAVRLRWGRVALAAIRRTSGPADGFTAPRLGSEDGPCGGNRLVGAVLWSGDALARAALEGQVRGYLIDTFGPDPAPDPADPVRDPVALCRDLLILVGLTPEAAAREARVWRELPRARIVHLRRVKNLIPWMVLVRPHLPPAGPLARTVDAWAAVRHLLP
ncbi:hypothetical protein [Streptomyces sp. NPDC051567]|uniref:hypothetical protein n=1 Tax=Streptomyces sp. NPDC051567 TaxID=3365660 RepID=UPI003787B357